MKKEQIGPDGSDNMVIDVIDDLVDTQITLEDGSRVRILMDERTVAQVVLAYRAALERLREPKDRKKGK